MIQTADKRMVASRTVGKYFAQIAMVFAVQFAAGKLGEALPIINSGGVGPVWPASGIALAALLLFGYEVWPGVAAGSFLLTLLSPIPFLAAAIYAAGTTLTALTGAFLLRGVVNFDRSLSRLRDTLGLIVLGAFGSSIVSASIGVSVLYAAQVRGWSGFGRAWLIYWLGDSMGVLLVTPLVLTFPNLLRIRTRLRLAELGVLLLALTAVCFIIFGDLASVSVKLDVLAFAVLPFVIWAALRFGVSGAALSTLFIASIATAETTSGSGPFDQNTPFINAAMLDVFFAVLSVSGLMLATVIAEREKAEREREQIVRKQAAMEARLRLATIVESSDDAIVGRDMNGIITDWNKGAERLYGYSAGEVIGKPISVVVQRDRTGDFADIMGRHDTVDHYETVHQRKDGARIEVSMTMSPIRNTEGRLVGTSVIGRDISERKRQETVLRESEERFRLVADTAPVLIWMAGTDELCTYFNKPWLDFTGRSIDDELGNGWAEGVHTEDLQRCMDTYTQAFDRREGFRMEYRLRRQDGEYRWILDIGVPRFDQDRSFIGYIGTGIDVTERRLAEERLREYEKAVEGSEEMIAVVDREYRYLIANRKFLNLRNLTKEQVEGHFVHEVLNKGVFEASVKDKLDECFRGEVVRYELKYTYPGLGERDVFASYFPIEGATGIDRAACILQDITDRKRTEAALRKSEELFRLAVQAGRMYAYEWDAANDTVVRSGENARVLGFSDQGEQLTRQQLVGRVHPDDRALFVGSVGQVTPENPTTHISYRVLRPDGSMVWLEKSARAFFDAQGKLLRMIGMVADITERKQAEEALRDSEARLRLAAQAGKMYAYDWDVATDVTVRSEEYANILGLTIVPTSETHHQFSSRVHPDDRAQFNAAIAALTPENPTTKIGYRVLRPDGAVIWLEKSGRAFFDAQGTMSRMIGIVADITERKLAEEALRESEDKLRLLLDSTAEAIYGMDLEGRCTFCNPACLRALGYTRVDELLGKSMHALIHHTRADGTLFPLEECRIFRALRTGEGAHVDDEVLWRANGTSFAAEYWSYPQRRGQEVVGAVVAFIDITQRKLAEAAVANVSLRLIEAQEQERTRIARELHDDIGQRLALLAVELEQLQQDAPNLPKVRSRIGELQKQTSEIATDIQTLSHELHSSKLEYLGIAAAMRSFCQEFGQQTKAEIEFKSDDLPGPLAPHISLCLFRVLQEALHNSAKHSGAQHVEVRLWGTSDEIHLAVTDSGAGFDSEAAKKGRGLGLISMEERLKLVKGTFSIKSQPKRGTTIHARVPFSSGTDSMRAAG